MYEFKLIHVNDGDEKELTNGDWLYAAELVKAENFLAPYIEEGFRIRQMIPSVVPDGKGGIYNDGFIVCLERDTEN